MGDEEDEGDEDDDEEEMEVVFIDKQRVNAGRDARRAVS